MDYSALDLPALRAELARVAAAHEALAIERAAIADELRERERKANARSQVGKLAEFDTALLKDELDRRARGMPAALGVKQ